MVNQDVYLRLARRVVILTMITAMILGCDDESPAQGGTQDAERDVAAQDQLTSFDMNVAFDLTVGSGDTGSPPIDLGVEARDSGEEPNSDIDPIDPGPIGSNPIDPTHPLFPL